jgi:UDP-N-acetylglucosamine 2-epimerase (non-hydrolysing)
VVFGTRPEAIKMCPLVLALRQYSQFDVKVCVTGQHRKMLDQVLDLFAIHADADLAAMQPGQSLSALTSRLVAGLDECFAAMKPDFVIVQGDTTTAFCGALVAFYHAVRVGHVEAGLRTGNLHSPFPEEANRVIVSRLADLHFAPTASARDNLLAEGISPQRVFVTGNTGIDALFHTVQRLRQTGIGSSLQGVLPAHLHMRLFPGAREEPAATGHDVSAPRVVLITGHRRESFGAGFERICGAIRTLATLFPQVEFIYPVHLNPCVREPVFGFLGRCHNVSLLDPLPYLEFVALMERAHLILTDSGGVQEEAPSLGKPVLVMRDTTERLEGVEAGTVSLVGTQEECIVREVSRLLIHSDCYAAMTRPVNPYGDGHASERIVRLLMET